MPNRIARDSARTSKTLAQLSDFGERGFWRLMLTADDFGRFEADPPVVLAQCFPRLAASVTLRKVEAMLAECVAVGLIILYEVEGVGYGQFVKADKYFTRRSKHSKYPPCVASATQTHSTCVASAPEVRGARIEVSRNEVARNTPLSGLSPTGRVKEAVEIITWLNAKTGRQFEAHTPSGRPTTNLEFVLARLKDGREAWQIKAVVSRKVREWAGTEQAKYLRPATLFNKTKFEQYIGELPPVAEASPNG